MTLSVGFSNDTDSCFTEFETAARVMGVGQSQQSVQGLVCSVPLAAQGGAWCALCLQHGTRLLQPQPRPSSQHGCWEQAVPALFCRRDHKHLWNRL